MRLGHLVGLHREFVKFPTSEVVRMVNRTLISPTFDITFVIRGQIAEYFAKEVTIKRLKKYWTNHDSR